MRYIEVFNRGKAPFEYRIRPAAPWLTVSRGRGQVDEQVRATLRVDWSQAPKGTTRVPITVSGPHGSSVTVTAVVEKPSSKPSGFAEAGGYVSMDADHFTNALSSNGVWWKRIPDLGRTGNAVEPFPGTAASQTPGGSSPRLEYRMTLNTTGPVKVTAFMSPRNPVLSPDGLRYAVSIDNAAPQVVNITKATGANDTTMNKQWERNTSDNVNRTTTTHQISKPGTHVLKFWMVDPTVALQNIVVDTGGLRPTTSAPLRAGGPGEAAIGSVR